MMNRRVRLFLLTPLVAGSLIAAPAVLAWGPAAAAAPAAAPSATCSISGVLPGGTVHLSGGGFTPGTAFLSSPTAAGGSFTIGADGGFQMMNVENGSYMVSQGNDRTQCSGFKETDKTEKTDETDKTDKTEQQYGQEENGQKPNEQNHNKQNEHQNQNHNQNQNQNDEDGSR